MPIQYAEGEISWNGFLKEVGFNPPTAYEVSGVSVIPKDESAGPKIILECLDGDYYLAIGPLVGYTTEPSIEGTGITLQAVSEIVIPADDIEELRFVTTTIGLESIPNLRGVGNSPVPAPFDITVTATILCVSPSSFMTVGGEWQATDTTALIIGYSVLNAYWLAPIGISIGLGVYLTRNKWQRR